MLGYIPEIYPDETVYSWICRYFSHNGYPVYSLALQDLMESPKDRAQYEFISKFNSHAKNAIKSMSSMETLILDHTMFPYYCKFEPLERRILALEGMIKGAKNIDSLMQIPNDKTPRYLSYCPLCSLEDRKIYGETFFHRLHQIRDIGVCSKHRCKLVQTTIQIYGNSSPRLHVPEHIIPKNSVQIEGNEEQVKYAEYMENLFQQPISFSNSVQIQDFLISKIEGTQYMPQSGACIYTKSLTNGINGTCKWLPPIRQHRVYKVLSGEYRNFTLIARIGLFLGIPSHEMANPYLPAKSQKQRFIENVKELSNQGYKTSEIGRMLNASEESIHRVTNPSPPKEHFRGVRKGKTKEDWGKLDAESLPAIKGAISKLKNEKGRPGRVTLRAVCKSMGWPSKRLNCLPLCKAEVLKNIEPIEEFWAKEVIWAFKSLKEGCIYERIYWRDIRNLTNSRREQFLLTFPFLGKYTTPEIAGKIQEL